MIETLGTDKGRYLFSYLCKMPYFRYCRTTGMNLINYLKQEYKIGEELEIFFDSITETKQYQ